MKEVIMGNKIMKIIAGIIVCLILMPLVLTITLNQEQAHTDAKLVDVIARNNFTRLNMSSVEPYDSLVAYFPFDNNHTLDATTYDYSNYSGNATPLGDPLFINGIYGNASYFDGTDDYFDAGNLPQYDITGNSISISMWIYGDAGVVQWDSPFCKSSTGGFADAYCFLYDSGTSFKFYINKYNEGTATFSMPLDSNWHHVVGVYDGTNVYIYNNTQQNVGSAYSSPITTSGTPLYIGRGGNDNSYNWIGGIDDIMIFNYALNQSQIDEIYNNQSNRFVNKGYQEIKNQDYLNLSGNRINVTVDNFEALFGSSVNVSVGYYNSGWLYSEDAVLVAGNTHVFNLSAQSVMKSINFTLIAGNSTNNFFTPKFNPTSITLDNWSEVEIPKPQITIISPLNQTYIQTYMSFNITATAVNNISSCWYNIDDDNITLINDVGDNFYHLNSSIESGNYKANYYCNDSLDNINGSESISFIITTGGNPPEITITHPTATSYNTNISELNYTATDDVGLSACWYSIDGGITNSTPDTTCSNFTEVTSTEGSNTWIVYANDSSNQINFSSVAFIKDTVSPDLLILSPLNQTYNQIYLDFNVTATDSTSSIDTCWYNLGDDDVIMNSIILESYNNFNWSLNESNVDARGITTNGSDFWVTDVTDDFIYHYNSSYDYVDGFDLTIGNGAPYDLTNYGGLLYVVDYSTKAIYIYNMSGDYISKTIDNFYSPNGYPLGITTNGSTFWISDYTDIRIYEYNMSFDFLNSYDVGAKGMSIVSGIATDNKYIWVADETGYIFKFNMSFDNLSVFSTAPYGNLNINGITVKNSKLWAVDYIDNAVYQYNLTESYTYTNSSIADGSYLSQFYCNDTLNNINNTESVAFTMLVDIFPPNISIDSPNNRSYNYYVNDLNYTYQDTNPDSCWYSNNSGVTNSTSVSAGTNFTISTIEGNNTRTLYCNDTKGLEDSSSVTFNVLVNPDVEIIYPINMTYNTPVTELNYTAFDNNLDSCWYKTETSGSEPVESVGSTPTSVSGERTIDDNNYWGQTFASITSGSHPIFTARYSGGGGNVIRAEIFLWNETSQEIIGNVLGKTSLNIDDSNLWQNFTIAGVTLKLNEYYFVRLIPDNKGQSFTWSKDFNGYGQGTAVHYNATSGIYTPDTFDFMFDVFIYDNLTIIVNDTIISCGQNVTGLVSYEGMNIWSVYANDTFNNKDVDMVIFDVFYPAPNLTLTNPNDLIHVNTIQNFTVQIGDANGIKNTTLYIYNSTNDLVNQTFTDFPANPVYAELGINVLLDNNDTYTWFYNSTNIYNKVNQSEIRTIIFDAEPPLLNWDNPVAGSNPVTDISSFTVGASAFDPYLDATNITVYNASGDEIYNDFVPNITENISYFNDTITLDEGDNIIQICARDSLASSPKIKDKVNFNKLDEEITEFILPDTKKLTRTINIYDSADKKLKATDHNLITLDNWIDNDRHYKTTWTLENLPAGAYFVIELDYQQKGDFELLTDRGVTRIVDRGRNYYWRFDDLDNAGFKTSYKWDDQNKKISIIVTQGAYSPSGIIWTLDPITGGLNTVCRDETIRLDTTAPTGESGGHGGSGTTPSNNSYTNVAPVNFTVNATDDTGISNITLIVKNESDDIINQTFVDVSGYSPTEIFFGIIYYLWYEGIYKWSYQIYDIVGNLLTTTEAVITYDITNPYLIIEYPLPINYSVDVSALNYTYTEINCNDTYYISYTGLNYGFCYQEFANVSTVCGGLDTGLYKFTGIFTNPQNIIDGDFNTYGNFQLGINYIYINYTIPPATNNNDTWTLKTSFASVNLSLSQCYDGSGVMQLRIKGNSSGFPSEVETYDCYNSGWINLYSLDNTYHIYEEAIIWNLAETQTANCGQNFTGLNSTEGYNTFYLYMRDLAGNINSTYVTFFKDTIYPIIDFDGDAEINNSYVKSDNVFTSIDLTELNLANITYELFDATSLYDSQIYYTETYTHNFTSVADDTYYYNVTICDTSGNCNTTETRTITVDTTTPVVTLEIANVSTDSFPFNMTINYTVSDLNINNCSYKINASLSGLLNCSETSAEIPVYAEANDTLTFFAEDLSTNIGNATDDFFIFHHTYGQVSEVDNITTEGSVIEFNLTINVTYRTDAEAYLVYDEIEYPADLIAFGSNYYKFRKVLAIPDGTGSAVGNPVNWNWKYSIEGNSYWVTNYTTSNETQTVFSVDIDDCSLYNYSILNFTLNDEATATTIASNLTPVVELEIQIISWGDETIEWLFERYYNSTGQVCIPDDLLNYSDYRIDITIGLIADGYVKEFWFLENGTLDQTDYFNSYTPHDIQLYDLLAVDSTTFLFEFIDGNGLHVDDAIIHTYRKYIGEGLFREVERSKQDENGETHVHLVEEDEIYYFVITQNGQIIYTSSTYNAKCLSQPCLIQLEAQSELSQFNTDWDLMDNGTYAFSSDIDTRIVSLSFSSDGLANMNLTVYEYETNPDGYNINIIDSESVTATAGVLQVAVPESYGDKILYYAIHKNNELLKKDSFSFEESGKDIFGRFGVILTGFLVLVLILMSITEGAVLVIFIILGLVISTILKLINLGWIAFTGIVIAGLIIIIKLANRRKGG